MSIEEIVEQYRNGDNLNKDVLISLYDTAKDRYHAGNPIIEDFEFDELEIKLGLENKSYVGTRHNPSYTEKHPYLMGSLSKVQIHEKDGVINFSEYYTKAINYIKRNYNNPSVIITPKYDGCSFEAFIEDGEIKSISTRGDGEYGSDISRHIVHLVKRNLLGNQTEGYPYTLRGEVLIDKTTFLEKYSVDVDPENGFVNPRSFVAGVLSRDFDSYSAEFLAKINDLSIVIYDIRVKLPNNLWFDYDWDNFDYPDKPSFYFTDSNFTELYFEEIYNKFNKYRGECPFALDGIVIKPTTKYRENNLIESRPKDCVAIKFVPILQETEVVKIEWNIKKFAHMIPTIWVKPVTMDGKIVQKCSGSNYSNLLKKKVSIGTKVIMSLAGDIIPFLYRVTDTTKFDENKLDIPTNINSFVDGVHLTAILSKEEIAKMKFINSAISLNIPNLGPAETTNIWNYITSSHGETDDFFEDSSKLNKMLPTNILFLSPEDVYFGITSATKNGATGKAKKISKAFEEVVHNITLKEIIKSCNFAFCGDTVSEQVANYLMGVNYDFTHLASKGYTWCLKEENEEENTSNMDEVAGILWALGKSIEDFKTRHIIETVTSKSNEDAIPVILTGDPNNYATKAEFKKCHPEYREVKTTKAGWGECKILFTNSLESKTKKMQEAEKRGIEIRIY